jgi:hypothetical protein
VDDEVDVDVALDERGGDGVDEERHVVGDDLDHRAGARPTVAVGRGVEHAHDSATWRAGLGDLEVRLHGPCEGERWSRAQLLIGHVTEVATHDDRPVRAVVEVGKRRDDGVERGRSGLDR